MRRAAFAALLILSTGTAFAAARSWAYFLGASEGVAVPFETVALPVPAPDGNDLPRQVRASAASAFAPRLEQLLEGEIVIETERQMREVWARLFDVPYDASLFDFGETFVVLMGGGTLAFGSFDIAAVEQVDATYATPGGFGDRETETFLSVTATTFLPGVMPQDPPPPQWHVSAVNVARELLDDIVFRRNVVLGI